MKSLLAIAIFALPISGKAMLCRVTFYDAGERGGAITSCGTKPVEGITAAVDPKIFGYGTRIHIPALAGLVNHDGEFIACDTGRHVKSRKAARAWGKNIPVVDIYIHRRTDLNRIIAQLGKEGHFLEVKIKGKA